MIGVLIIAHGNLGDSLIHCASHVMGEQLAQLTHLDITLRDDPDKIRPRAQELVRQLDEGDGVLVLSDICGATPCNIGSQLVNAGRVECIAGVNLPMLVRVLTYRHEPLAVVVEKALTGGRQGVIHMTQESKHAV